MLDEQESNNYKSNNLGGKSINIQETNSKFSDCISSIITKKISKYHYITQIGLINNKPKKYNQDNYFIYKGLANNNNTHLFGVW